MQGCELDFIRGFEVVGGGAGIAWIQSSWSSSGRMISSVSLNEIRFVPLKDGRLGHDLGSLALSLKSKRLGGEFRSSFGRVKFMKPADWWSLQPMNLQLHRAVCCTEIERGGCVLRT